MRCFPDTEVIMFFDYGGPHMQTHIHILYYNILTDIMIILDHGSICVDTIFMILSCIVFQILKTSRITRLRSGSLQDNYIYIHIYIFIRHNLLTMKTYV